MRRAPRFDASIPCKVESEGGAGLEGVIVDLSAGGAGIEVRGADIPERFVLSFEFEDQAVRLHCSTRHARDLWSRRRIHAQFDDLSVPEQESLERVLASLQEAAAESHSSVLSLSEVARRVFRR